MKLAAILARGHAVLDRTPSDPATVRAVVARLLAMLSDLRATRR